MEHQDKKATLAEAKRVILEESVALAEMADRLTDDFHKAVKLVFECTGRIILTGMGKSGLVGQKIASTMTSTGTPTVFMHPAEAAHGDLGVITENDVTIAISYSGETAEVLAILPFFKRFGVKMIAMTSKLDSTLSRAADCTLDIGVAKEACPLGITPTSSSTATLAMGDALAVALINWRNFKREDFAIRHPGGSLGRQLLLRVDNLLHRGKDLPVVAADASLREAILEMSKKRLGMTTVVDAAGKMLGILTDGDLRRIMEEGEFDLKQKVIDQMTTNPKTISIDTLAVEALYEMDKAAITTLVIPDDQGKPLGIVHIHDLLKAGIS
jgi:arabinose-5-phosphate isomerase